MKRKLIEIWLFVKNSFVAILKAEFWFRLNVEKYIPQIIYTFFLFAVIIWCSLKTENALARVEQNNAQIEELLIVNSQKTYELERVSKRFEVAKNLKKSNSAVHENTKPATQISK